jgi:hypothetical protein
MHDPMPHSEICPRCEEGILSINYVVQEISHAGSLIRVPNVQVEECKFCGYRSISGKEAGVFEILFSHPYEDISGLAASLRAAGYHRMFLEEAESQTSLGFGSLDYVAALEDKLRCFYLDSESSHIIAGITSCTSKSLPVLLHEKRLTLNLPRLGEGENGIVFEYAEDAGSVVKLAKPRDYSRGHLMDEAELTRIFSQEGIAVPRIKESDPYGRFMIKEKLAGESLAQIYRSLGTAGNPTHECVRSTVDAFFRRLLKFFEQFPQTKTSLSPNNIFVALSDSHCECLLVDTGPAPFHNYSGFDFTEYWETTVPQKIIQYERIGYL